MNRRIRCLDVNLGQIGDFEEIGPDDWRGVDHERSAGICIYTWQMVITRLADLIGSGNVWVIEGPFPDHVCHVPIDRSRNVWLGPDYLDPSRYLPRLIPKSVPADA